MYEGAVGTELQIMVRVRRFPIDHGAKLTFGVYLDETVQEC